MILLFEILRSQSFYLGFFGGFGLILEVSGAVGNPLLSQKLTASNSQLRDELEVVPCWALTFQFS